MKTKEFIFNEKAIATTTINGDILFVAKDIAETLGYKDTRWALKLLDDDENLTVLIARSGQKRNLRVITESGLYHLIIKSSKPNAKAFRKWITSEVLPQIRKAGFYSTDAYQRRTIELQEVKKLIDKKKDKLTALQSEIKDLNSEIKKHELDFWGIFKADINQKKLF